MQNLLAYVQPQGPLPEVQGRGTLLVIGSACSVWEDLRRYDQSHGDQDRLAINDMIGYYPGRLQYGATLHADKLPGWVFGQEYRATFGGWPLIQIHSHGQAPRIDHVWPIHRDGGVSGQFAAIVGLLMGYSRVILAGIPADGRPRFFDPPWQNHAQMGLESCHDEWKRLRDNVPIAKERIRSLSGNTKEWFGSP